MKRYLALTAFSFLVCLVLVAGFTRLVDPYGYWGGPEIDGVNRYMPAAGRHLTTVKLRQVERVRPVTILVGNSRVSSGVDPDAAAWPKAARPIYNLGLSGMGTAELVDILLQAMDRNLPRQVVLAVDFVDFPLAEQEWRSWTAAALAIGLARAGRSPAFDRRPRRQCRGACRTAQGEPRPHHPRWIRFAGLLQRHCRSGGACGPVRAAPPRECRPLPRECKGRALARPGRLARLGGARPPGEGMPPPRHRAYLITYPYHADLLLAFAQTGLWPAFEDWHRGLAAFSARTGTPVWNFSRVSAETAEAVPARGDTRTRMRWYWEGGHFKAALGELVVADLTSDHPQLGAHLSPLNVEVMLASKTHALQDYRLARRKGKRDAEAAFARLARPTGSIACPFLVSVPLDPS